MRASETVVSPMLCPMLCFNAVLVAEQEKAHRERIRQKFAAARATCASDPGLDCEGGIAGFPDNP